MSRFKFYLGKIGYLVSFIWWRRWDLVKEEWNTTYQGMLDSKARFPEVEREALERLLKTLEEHGEHGE